MNKEQKEQLKKSINGLVEKKTKTLEDKVEKLFYTITGAKKGSGDIVGVVDRIDVKNFPTEIKVNNQPKELKINNLDDIDFPEPKESIKINNVDEIIEKMPVIKEIEVKEPKWYKRLSISDLTDKFSELFNNAVKKISNTVFRVDLARHRNPDKAIAVVMVDKKGRYVKQGDNGGFIATGGGGTAEASDFDVINVSVPTSDTDVSYILPRKTKQFFIKLRSQTTKLRLYKESGGDYFTVAQNGWLSPQNLSLIDQTIIIQATFTGDAQVAEIMVFK